MAEGLRTKVAEEWTEGAIPGEVGPSPPSPGLLIPGAAQVVPKSASEARAAESLPLIGAKVPADCTSGLLMVPRRDCRLGAVKTTSAFRAALYEVLGISVAKPIDPGPIMSGSPAQIVQSIFNQAFRLFSPRLIQLVVEESTSGRTFLWQSELQKEGYSIVNSEEFDHSSADPFLQVIPDGDWILQSRDSRRPHRVFNTNRSKQTILSEVPEALLDTFRTHKVVLSVAVALGDEWQGRLVICDADTELKAQTNLDVLRTFGKTMSRSIHAAHLCLRACREAAAEERSRLARELHDGTIQSRRGVALGLVCL